MSHKNTDYSLVQELHRRGHEIGVFSISNNDAADYWTEGTYDDWLAEMAGARFIVERFANLTDGSVIGVRAPFLHAGGNKQFKMMTDQYFVYDSSITAPLGRVPIWPYHLSYRIPHKCQSNAQKCPSRSYQVWEMVINELDRGQFSGERDFDDNSDSCHMVSSCSNIETPYQFAKLLRQNFDWHSGTNRAPLGLHFDASWLKSNEGFTEELTRFLDEKLDEGSVYVVTMEQVRKTVTFLVKHEIWPGFIVEVEG